MEKLGTRNVPPEAAALARVIEIELTGALAQRARDGVVSDEPRGLATGDGVIRIGSVEASELAAAAALGWF